MSMRRFDAPVTLRLMTAQDLPMLHEWLNRPHLVEWWGGERPSLEEVQAEYFPEALAREKVTPYIGMLGDVPFAYAQSYVAMGAGGGWWEDETDPGVRGIDQAIGDKELLGHGLGTRLVRALVDLLFEDPQVTKLQTDPAPDNLRAIRCYEKAGFRKVKVVATPDGPALYMVQSRPGASRSRFSRYLLRTTDVESATAFYDAVLGRPGDGILPLHEAALARGARPHWLGHVRVRELGGAEAVGARFVELGATRLGPTPGSGDFVILRDPGGAVIAVTDGAAESSSDVVWHQLHTRDAPAAAERYSTLFGWSFTTKLNLGELGSHQRFSFGAGESSVGLISGIEGRPEVHAHWLFYFAVPSLDAAVERVRQNGGVVIGPLALPNGVRVAACDDAQGAAFGLIEPHDAVRLGAASGSMIPS